jgi:hypothetical protein
MGVGMRDAWGVSDVKVAVREAQEGFQVTCRAENGGERGLSTGQDGTGGTSVLIDRTVFTDPVFGNDHTGKVEDPNHPFKTMTKALDTVSALHPPPAANNVWQLQARPGIYTETVHLHTCINLLGVSTANLGGEVFINGTITDSLVVSNACVPQINNIVINVRGDTPLAPFLIVCVHSPRTNRHLPLNWRRSSRSRT